MTFKLIAQWSIVKQFLDSEWLSERLLLYGYSNSVTLKTVWCSQPGAVTYSRSLSGLGDPGSWHLAQWVEEVHTESKGSMNFIQK